MIGNGGGVDAVITELGASSIVCCDESVLGESKDLENDSKSEELVSCSTTGCEVCSTRLGSTEVRAKSFSCTGDGVESKGSLLFQGGVLTSSSSTSGAFPTEIAVAPPAAFSPKYDVILISDESIIPLSSILPKSPKSSPKAFENKPAPMEFFTTLPSSASKQKSAS